MAIAIIAFVVIIILLISIGSMKIIKIIAVGIPILTAVLIGVFIVYPRLFPSLEYQLFLAVEKSCKNQRYCKVHLHEITPFRWDKAYFFSLSSDYTRRDIQRITGVNFIFHRNKNLSLFLYQGKVVKYGFSDPPDDDFVGRFSQSYYFNMIFNTGVDYYKITPQNDLLSIRLMTVGKYYTGYSTHVWGEVTNSTQISNFYLDRNKEH